MKLHFSITAAEELRERRGGRYVLYSVCLEGFLLGKARYSQLRRWDAQLRQLFGSAVPAFPPKFYLAMTKSMADERRSQLEQYLQNVTLDSNITNSDVFIGFFRKLQQDTFKIQTQKAFLDVYLADGSNIRLDIQTSDTAERILEVTLCKMGLSRELIKYFSLFFFQDHDDGALSVVKKVAEFELPYVSLQSMRELHCKLGIRKWYMDPSLDTLLMDCRASLNLLYMQAIQEVKRNWVKPTEGQMQELEFLQKNANKAKVQRFVIQFRKSDGNSDCWDCCCQYFLLFLELIREMQFYGYIRLDPCICDYPEEGCSADICVGNNEINCCIKLPTNQTEEVSFKINRLRSWQVTFLGAAKDGEEETLELRFEYNDSGTWQWIILYTKQAFLLSSCLKKMISEQMMKAAKEAQEMEIKMPESTKNSKKSSIRPKQVVHSGFISRKRFLVRPNEEDCVFEKIREEDL
ncbi:sorting nexin-31 isoform X1 [Gymnogyps californianus]|uniref:sorting nexin-31 isoform X1 n=1 Tax=Gymnogyps californianus TaxID=33616 RepID=UPI0021C602D3|nr:sorting nexin-31 isoform X1 [Gymnogyps californianus]